MKEVNLIKEMLEEKLANNVEVYDVHSKSSICSFCVIATGRNERHLKTLADDVEELMDKNDYEKLSRIGEKSGGWILLDYGDIIVHLFSYDMREYYNIERLLV